MRTRTDASDAHLIRSLSTRHRRSRRDGVVIWVFAIHDAESVWSTRAFAPNELLLSLDKARILNACENQPNARVPEYRVWVANGTVKVDAHVYFGTSTPSKRLRDLAQGELLRLRVPRPGYFVRQSS